MKTVRLFEYDSLKHEDITESQLKRLKAFDDSYARQKGNRRIFDWNSNRASRIRICQVNMGCDLRKERIDFLQKLKQVLSSDTKTVIQ